MHTLLHTPSMYAPPAFISHLYTRRKESGSDGVVELRAGVTKVVTFVRSLLRLYLMGVLSCEMDRNTPEGASTASA